MYDLKNINNLRGIERETLRISEDGIFTNSQHPSKLGHKLTNSSITVDFSENLLELITKPRKSIDHVLEELNKLHSFTLQRMDVNEIILNLSMPLIVSEKEVQVADFGESNSGKMKQVYRRGLEARYGKVMQVIAGIHYNFSFDEKLVAQKSEELGLTKSGVYFGVINNYFEYMWLLPYLFGASPICAKASVKNKPNYLNELDDEFYIGEYATSLRMSDLGYTSPAQKNLHISYKDVTSYVTGLIGATEEEFAPYERIGLYNDQGKRIQLNNSILQIENEYYSPVRPKQLSKRCERPACALMNRGVEYIEVRVLDVNPFVASGIDKQTSLFIEVMLMTCFMRDFNQYSEDFVKAAKSNLTEVAINGRNPSSKLIKICTGEKVLLKDYALELFTSIEKTALQMGREYIDAVSLEKEKVLDVLKTPSAILANHAKDKGYKNLVLELSKQASNEFRENKLDHTEIDLLERQVAESFDAERILREYDSLSLNEYIDKYYKSVCI
ncbi:glutamate--cysteine ligase [Francisella frigiditurris]|uniref:Glutamate--cysteine ligase n=1 Tax=Francisella frigiditurris TaxID=1542390 RepID=A0A1J0KVY0_9GAMM|nr:glutamate--cysteine ligase [Francisella frigiditurris]APC97826.1 glutamate--cysteine ligase [Francisella frigiditurris]